MKRSSQFKDPARTPAYPTVAIRDQETHGPVKFLNPTQARYDVTTTAPDPEHKRLEAEGPGDEPAKSIQAQVQWSSRDHRKGRHILVIPRSSPLAERFVASRSPRAIVQGVARMFTAFPYWDISWLIAVLFTVGCLIFIVCGLFYWLPLAYPRTRFPNEDTVAGGVLAFVGATLFQGGAVLLIFEACNDRATCQFGLAVERIFSDHLRPGHRPARYQQPGEPGYGPAPPTRQWQWFPTWDELRHHYIYEIGFLASITMSLGATIFYVSGILSLPGVYDQLSPGVLDGVYWLTYLVGGVLFILSSVLYVLETQPNWYTPQPHKLGWHIGVWNLIGSVGWTLAASFGYCSAEWCEYQSDLTLVWASAAFTIGSALLWYESLDKYVVIIEDQAH